jgi:aryl-alcohol dehydrogenase-like predicted oxidoreductase
MKTVELGRTGQHVSRVGLGVMQMGTAIDEATSFEMLDRYLDRGGNLLDTANCYMWWHEQGSFGGESEALLGRWFARRGRRDDVFLATKATAIPTDLDLVWDAEGRPDWDAAYRSFDGAGADTLRRSIDDSLRRLGTDHVDLFYVHVDDRATPLEETLEALAGIVEAGKARYLGWSNVRTWRLERIRQLCDRHGWPAPVAVQQYHTYLRRRGELDVTNIVTDELLDYLREHDDLTLVGYSPLVHGAYVRDDRRTPPGPLDPFRGPDTDARLAAVDEVAAELGVSGNQVVLAWLAAQDNPPVASLIGPRTLEQFEDSVRAVDVHLGDEHLAHLDAAGA